jgi:hypothetical protein
MRTFCSSAPLEDGGRRREDAKIAEKRGVNEREGAKGKAPRGGRVLWAHVGPPMDRGAVRFWAPVCAPRSGDVGFFPRKVGLKFFIFRRRGVAQKGSQMCVGELLKGGGGRSGCLRAGGSFGR